MTEAEILKLIRTAVREELAPALLAMVVENTDQKRLTYQRFKTEGQSSSVRSLQPFGLTSRAPKGTPTLILPVNFDATHSVSIGNFDEDRPTGDDGETLLYDAYGHVIYMSQTKIQVGSKTSAENMVLGQVAKLFYQMLLTQLQAETHISGPPGFPTSPPVNAPAYASLKASPIDDDAILSDKVFTEK